MPPVVPPSVIQSKTLYYYWKCYNDESSTLYTLCILVFRIQSDHKSVYLPCLLVPYQYWFYVVWELAVSC